MLLAECLKCPFFLCEHLDKTTELAGSLFKAHAFKEPARWRRVESESNTCRTERRRGWRTTLLSLMSTDSRPSISEILGVIDRPFTDIFLDGMKRRAHLKRVIDILDAIDEKGRCPLHLICKHDAPSLNVDEVINLLSIKSVWASAVNTYGSTPLHFYCKTTGSASDDSTTSGIISTFYTVNPLVLCHKDCNGWTPERFLAKSIGPARARAVFNLAITSCIWRPRIHGLFDVNARSRACCAFILLRKRLPTIYCAKILQFAICPSPCEPGSDVTVGVVLCKLGLQFTREQKLELGVAVKIGSPLKKERRKLFVNDVMGPHSALLYSNSEIDVVERIIKDFARSTAERLLRRSAENCDTAYEEGLSISYVDKVGYDELHALDLL